MASRTERDRFLQSASGASLLQLLEPALQNLRIVEVMNQPDVVTAFLASIIRRFDNASRRAKLYHEREYGALYEREGALSAVAGEEMMRAGDERDLLVVHIAKRYSKIPHKPRFDSLVEIKHRRYPLVGYKDVTRMVVAVCNAHGKLPQERQILGCLHP